MAAKVGEEREPWDCPRERTKTYGWEEQKNTDNLKVKKVFLTKVVQNGVGSFKVYRNSSSLKNFKETVIR